jgi:hypothetical protein
MIEKFIDQLKENNFLFERVTDELIWIKNYLKQNELDTIMEIIDGSSQEDWEVEYMSNLSRFCIEKFGRTDVDALVAEGKFEITQNWVDKNLNIGHHPVQYSFYNRLNKMIINSNPSLVLSGLATIQRMQPGVELKSHVDQDTDPSIRYATIIYINDDYAGGELFFKNIDIKVRPKPGDLLFFPGDSKHEHGVRHVKDGPIRYVIVGFVKEKGFYQKNKY